MYVSMNKELHLVKYIFLVQSKKNIPKTHTKKKDKTTKVLQGNLVIDREGLVQNSNSAIHF